MSQRMKRLGLWLGLPLLLLVAVVFVVPGLRVRVLGALRGEPFFEGRPASAWATDVVDSRDGARAASSLKKGGRAALPVLMELALHGSPEAQPKARAVIVQIGDLAVPALSKSLEASAADERRLAASVFGDLGGGAKPALPALVRLLKDPDDDVAKTSAAALEKLGPAASAAVPELIPLLEGNGAALKTKAAMLLGKIGPEAKPAVPALVRALGDDAVRGAAMEALARIGEPAVEPLAKALTTADVVAARAAAAAALGAIGPKAKAALPALTAALAEPKSGIRADAAVALAQIGIGKEHLPALVAALGDADAQTRAAVANTIARLGAEARPAVAVLVKTLGLAAPIKQIGPAAVPELTGLLADDGTRVPAQHFLRQFKEGALPGLFDALEQGLPPVRTAVATLLRPDMGSAKEIMPKLLGAAHDKDPAVRAAVRVSITQFGKEALPFLQTGLRAKEDTVRREAAVILGSLKSEGRSAAPLLLKTLEDPSAEVRLEVVRALAAMNYYPKEAQAILLEALNKDRATAEALSLLAAHGPDAKEAGPVAAQALAAGDERTREAAAHALAEIGADAETVDALLKALGDKSPVVRRHAIRALGASRSIADRVVPALIKQLADNDTRAEALNSIGKLGAGARAAVPELLKIAEGDGVHRAACVIALGRIGPPAKEAVPTLHGLLKGTDRELSGQATEALGLIGAGEAAPTLETYWVDACAARRHDAAAAAALALWRVSKSDKALAYLQERVREKSPDAAVLKAIAGVGAPAQNNVPDLIRVLNGDPDVTKRLLAADALGRIGLADHKAIPPLITALKHPDVELRIRAARALARFEDAADNAVSRLLDLIHDPVSPRLRYAAGEALRQIDPVAARDAGIP